MAQEKIIGIQTGVYGNASVLGGAFASCTIPGDIVITPESTSSEIKVNGKIVRQVIRDTALNARFPLLVDTSKTPYPKQGDTVPIATKRWGTVNFIIQMDPTENRRDGNDATFEITARAIEGIDYTSS